MITGVYYDVNTVGELKELLKDVPDTLPLIHQTDGHISVLRQGMSLLNFKPSKDWQPNTKGFDEVIQFSDSYKNL
jgi:hypothetical protein